MKQTLYQILGVDAKASQEEISAAYAEQRAAASSASLQDTARITMLRQANEILSDPGRRAAYDRSLAGTGARRPVTSYGDLEPSFLQSWGKWIVAAVVVTGLGGWWATRGKPPAQERPVSERTVSPTIVKPGLQSDQAPRASGTPASAPGSPSQPGGRTGTTTRSAEDVFADVSRSIARVNAMDGSGKTVVVGSGVVIDSEVVLTNCHVAKRGDALSVRFAEGTSNANLELADESLDLCRLSVPGLKALPVTIGSVGELRTGQRVYAVGAPMGLDLTISEGIVSALRVVDDGTVIQTTAPISPGSSGGGLFDLSGRLVGIMTFQHRYGQNLNFALPADWIAQMRARGPADPAHPPVAAGQQQDISPAITILGQWSCRGSISGRSGNYTFEPDGGLTVAMTDGKTMAFRYRVSGKVLLLGDSTGTGVFAIEELNAGRMVLNIGSEGQRLVCDRR